MQKLISFAQSLNYCKELDVHSFPTRSMWYEKKVTCFWYKNCIVSQLDLSWKNIQVLCCSKREHHEMLYEWTQHPSQVSKPQLQALAQRQRQQQ